MLDWNVLTMGFIDMAARRKRVGRPSTYNNHSLRKFRAYLQQCDNDNNENDTVNLPTVTGLALYMKCNRELLYTWARQVDSEGELVHVEFSHMMHSLKSLTEQMLVNNGLTGKYKSPIVKLALQNLADWTDKTETTQTINKNIRSVHINIDMSQEDASDAYKLLVGNHR